MENQRGPSATGTEENTVVGSGSRVADPGVSFGSGFEKIRIRSEHQDLKMIKVTIR